jgi:O-antigen/teichoic acid export membrane protein
VEGTSTVPEGAVGQPGVEGDDGSTVVPVTQMGAIRASLVMLVGVACANGGNYVFHLATARALGPSTYGDVVALLTLASLVSLPLASLQVVVSRYVARLAALDEADSIRSLNRHVVIATSTCAVVTTLLIAALTPIIQNALSIGSAAAVIVTAGLTLPTALTPIVWGVAQGFQRFKLLAAGMILGTLARIVVLVLFLAVGLTSAEAITATLFGGILAFAIPLFPLRSWFGRPAVSSRRRPPIGRALRTIAPASIALLAFTSLTQTDVLVANAVFDGTTSGIYSAASLIGRIILYLPAAIVSVLLPKVAARAASNLRTDDILGLSLIATLAFCAVAVAIYIAVPGPIVRVALGSNFGPAGPLLYLFGISTTLFAVLNVLVYYHLGRQDNVFAWVLAGGAIIQGVAFGLLHASPRWLIADSIIVAALLLITHELLTRLSMLRAISNSLRNLSSQLT